MKNLHGRVAVVTGAGSGIGRALSLALAQEHCRLALCDIDSEGLSETARWLETQGYAEVVTHSVDVSNKSRMCSYAEEVASACGPASILINNAGVAVSALFDQHSLEDFEWVMGINFWGTVYGSKFFMPQLRSADEAHIVNISSVFGLLGAPMYTGYCASKYAVRGFTEALRVELRRSTVGVTSVHPGAVRTGIARATRSSDSAMKRRGGQHIERWGIDPTRAAQQIIGAIKNNRARQLVAAEAYVTDAITRLSPAFARGLAFHRWQQLRRQADRSTSGSENVRARSGRFGVPGP
jgi:short-subunit dehydrogenase